MIKFALNIIMQNPDGKLTDQILEKFGTLKYIGWENFDSLEIH